jgi:hypothetical protein
MKNIKNLMPRVAVAAMGIAASAASFAQTTDASTQAITDAQTKLLAMIAVGGAAVVAVALAKVGFGVAAKWIGRLGSKS